MASKEKRFSTKKILAIIGFAFIGVGALIIAFLPDTSRGVEVVNAYGAFLIIIGLFVFVAIFWMGRNAFDDLGITDIQKARKDAENKKGIRPKLKVSLLIIALIISLMFIFI